MLSILKREFPDGNFQSLFEGSSRVVVPPSSSSTAADPLLSSFISPLADGLFISESSSAKKTSNQSFPERYLLHSSSSDWFSYIHSLIVLVLIWILKEC